MAHWQAVTVDVLSEALKKRSFLPGDADPVHAWPSVMRR
jgi:hypothetical protein